jgi:guanine deaminase
MEEYEKKEVAAMKNISNRKCMELAIREARKNLKSLEGGPFGACMVKDGMVVAVARNTVFRGDATAHAEINAIRKACRKLGTHDLSGCIIYSTTEPCPMCFSAIHWARIGAIVYGTTIADAKRSGFHELEISTHEMKTLGRSKVRIVRDIMRMECLELFKAWIALPDRRAY